jgi:hypothetical protein
MYASASSSCTRGKWWPWWPRCPGGPGAIAKRGDQNYTSYVGYVGARWLIISSRVPDRNEGNSKPKQKRRAGDGECAEMITFRVGGVDRK